MTGQVGQVLAVGCSQQSFRFWHCDHVTGGGNGDVDIDNTAIEPNAGETHSVQVFQNLQLRKLQSIPGFTDC